MSDGPWISKTDLEHWAAYLFAALMAPLRNRAWEIGMLSLHPASDWNSPRAVVRRALLNRTNWAYRVAGFEHGVRMPPGTAWKFDPGYLLIIASYVVALWLPEFRTDVVALLGGYVVWLLLDAAILIWHFGKSFLLIPQIPFLLNTYQTIEVDLMCSASGLTNCIW